MRSSSCRLRQCDPSADGDTRQRETGERDCRPVAVSVGVVAEVESTAVYQNAETDSERGEAASERQRCPDFESVPSDFSCSRPGEKDASRYLHESL